MKVTQHLLRKSDCRTGPKNQNNKYWRRSNSCSNSITAMWYDIIKAL